MNKCDLAATSEPQVFDPLFGEQWRPIEAVRCSALTGEGLLGLEDALARVALGGETLNAEETLVETARQAQALREAAASLQKAIEGLQAGRGVELICIDLRAALDALSSVTGMNVGEAVLDRIFSDFCIGK
jgi:tRNA modification GTPase